MLLLIQCQVKSCLLRKSSQETYFIYNIWNLNLCLKGTKWKQRRMKLITFFSLNYPQHLYFQRENFWNLAVLSCVFDKLQEKAFFGTHPSFFHSLPSSVFPIFFTQTGFRVASRVYHHLGIQLKVKTGKFSLVGSWISTPCFISCYSLRHIIGWAVAVMLYLVWYCMCSLSLSLKLFLLLIPRNEVAIFYIYVICIKFLYCFFSAWPEISLFLLSVTWFAPQSQILMLISDTVLAFTYVYWTSLLDDKRELSQRLLLNKFLAQRALISFGNLFHFSFHFVKQEEGI